MTDAELIELLDTLCGLDQETEHVEFKKSFEDPEEIGEYVSALSNSARLLRKEAGYLVWGVEDQTHAVVGTTFKPRKAKAGNSQKNSNQELESWLSIFLNPRIDIRFHEVSKDGKAVVILEVPPCQTAPTRWRDIPYIRVGSYKKKLTEYIEKERSLWTMLMRVPFEEDIAKSNVSGEEVLRLLDFSAYYDLTKKALPNDTRVFLEHLVTEKMIVRNKTGRFDITNFGAILFAKKLTDFDRVGRKAIRVIHYNGNNRVMTQREYLADIGYANGYEALVAYINSQLPANEHIGQALSVDVREYPEIAIRELVANALIHQDFSLVGDGPLVEIFGNRVEFTNGGQPLIEPLRFADEPPQSRNEQLAKFLHRIRICEERGSGVDKTLTAIEIYQLPAPEFRVTNNHTVVTVFSHGEFKHMNMHSRIWACYWHTVLMHLSRQQMTNTTLRERLAIDESKHPYASKVIQDTLKANLIRPYDPDNQSRRHARYVPIWA